MAVICAKIKDMVALEVYQETVEFMATGPKPEQIVSFKPSEKMEERVRELIFREKEGLITEDEKKELDEILFFDHIMRLIKSRASQYVA